jgi:hypothetical protein
MKHKNIQANITQYECCNKIIKKYLKNNLKILVHLMLKQNSKLFKILIIRYKKLNIAQKSNDVKPNNYRNYTPQRKILSE